MTMTATAKPAKAVAKMCIAGQQIIAGETH
jgi:hypothetical protein